ncbi:ADR328Wp [Eremothecium gossypii ATCC 10895]|uniref:Presequence translocated-associated motor subunit PAM17, mitochondrial n=1 Tax=Eremothecium gossypii (strain ATCC 10895 / CBS 109.51 / FGSC 9923 / NRRL Y-1056) TaxID=284811 RepID=PAM17_EREGS|nr:ADR328Wp [Eremothecium gossypii ATCC 10895]Q759E9.1 RecName: Full=Presequence translocated-associated motor subunit PAM17, mitochondrial; Flags: Precursor [Eremothecium gossypii ATCC 10895]AAS52248.1 ADR328Wp [Eremothecium gossypii ATCC 10895]AEY96547.1 FADR328Wp [Eremothecium gossypii FDAG1]
MLARGILRPALARAELGRAFSCSAQWQQAAGSTSGRELSWPDFFALRKTERRINTGSSVLTAFLTANCAWAYISTVQIDVTQMLFGFDPMVVLVGALFASSGLGYLCGPLMGSAFFRVKHRGQLEGYNHKNRVFLEHIKKNRVDASSQSFSNPLPDYYGEKIGSLQEYRQWLRDCQSHRRKAKEFL